MCKPRNREWGGGFIRDEEDSSTEAKDGGALEALGLLDFIFSPMRRCL